jgi:hypothetical protein
MSRSQAIGMCGPKGNPTAANLFNIIASLQEHLGCGCRWWHESPDTSIGSAGEYYSSVDIANEQTDWKGIHGEEAC